VFTIFSFILGTLIGSFLNCVIYRLETKKSFIRGRSFCPHCKHPLSFLELIPLFGFFYLKGRCRYCHQRISFWYPFVEFITGILFFLAFKKFSSFGFITLIYYWIIFSFFILIFVFDAKYYLIPDKIVYPPIIISLIFNLFLSPNFLLSFLSGVMISGFFFLIFFISQGKWIGFGDIKLGFLIGLVSGFPNFLIAFFFSFFFGAIIGIGLILLKKKTLRSELPLGPFLVTGGLIAVFIGEKIFGWYLNLF